MAARRAAQKATQDSPVKPDPAMVDEHVKKVRRDNRDTGEITSEGIGQDRQDGLPRSNYYEDWGKTVQKMDPHVINKILDHPAIKSARRG
jgi:hypothetical protein